MNHLSWPKLLANVFSCSMSHCDTVSCVYAWVTSRRINIIFTASGIASTNNLTRKIVFSVCQKKRKEENKERREKNQERERERVNDSELFCGISAIRREICLFSFCHIMLNQYIFRVFDVIFIVGLQFSLWKRRVLRLTLKRVWIFVWICLCCLQSILFFLSSPSP